jgi:DNA repair exonuclease SbcCD ATPase subunit
MASFQNFRSAFNGFNREDVVRYIEFVNNKHNTEINQLNTQIQSLYSDLEYYQRCYDESVQLSELLQLEQARTAALEQELAELKQQMTQLHSRPQTNSELEAYRRAERAERTANERVNQLYSQANGVLADATARTDETAEHIAKMTEQVCAQLSQLQAALADDSSTIREAAASMYAIKPISAED